MFTRRFWLICGIALVVVAVAATVLVIVLRKDDGEPAAKPAPEPTVWQRISTSAGKDGVVGKDASLQAFAYLFGNVPGVQAPQGRPDEPGFKTSGTGAISWVLNHRKELSAEQRTAVAAAISPAEPQRLHAPGPLALHGPPNTNGAEVKPVTELLKRRQADIAKRVGYDIPEPKVVLAGTEKGDKIRAWTAVLPKGVELDPNGLDNYDTSGPAAECRVHLPPSTWSGAATQISELLDQTLTHELIHCFQGFSYPTLDQHYGAPAWIREGGADFGASDITGRAPRSSWGTYLTQPGPLFARSYDAMGWWFHVQHAGQDPWKALPTIWKGAQVGAVAYQTAGGNADNVLDTWGSSFLRNPGFGDAWEVHGTSVTAEKPPVSTINAQGGSIVVEPFDARAYQLSVGGTGGAGTMILKLQADHFVRLHDAAGFEQGQVSNGQYCVGTQCVCPEKTKKAGQRIEPQVQAPIFLGVSGGESGTKVGTETMTLEEYCEKDDEKKGDSRAGSDGEPHLTSFDGREFDFQAGGEFTLARSNSGDLEIQSRQEPLRTNGKEELGISVNTAVAARVGKDKVGVYPSADGLRVRINGGQPAVVPDEQRLPSGGAVAQHSKGYDIRWPDGTTLTVLPIGDFGLNVITKTSAGRQRTLHGMLGPYEGVDNNPAMQDRGGKRYTTPDSDTLYKVIGESWRIKQADSLFDYAPGQSTDTFTRREMPNRLITLKDLAAERRASAEQTCAVIKEPTLRKECVFDVALTGDTRFSEGYQTVEKVVNRGGIQDGATVSGNIATPEQVDTYQVELAAGEEFRIADEPDDLKFSLFGTDESNEHALPGRINGLAVTSFRVNAAGTYTLKVAKDNPGAYKFRFLMVKPQRSAAKIGDRLTARLDQPGRVAEFTIDSGESSEFRAIADNCEDIWYGIDEADQPDLNPGQVLCKPGQPHTFTVEPGKRYVLVVWSSTAKTGEVTFQTERI